MKNRAREFLKAGTTAGAGAGVGAAAYGVFGGVGVAAGGTAVGITLGPFIAIGAGIGLAGYGVYRLGKQIGAKGKKGTGVPRKLDNALLSRHAQLDEYSCIPMCVELVLKLMGRVAPGYFELQQEWQNRRDGSFGSFDGRVIEGIRFQHGYAVPRDEKFPLDGLFLEIERELAEGRYVIISLVSSGGWHMFVIHERLPSGEFRAVSKRHGGSETLVVEDVREVVSQMKGTDILTYRVLD
jgi:hypothetical protein